MNARCVQPRRLASRRAARHSIAVLPSHPTVTRGRSKAYDSRGLRSHTQYIGTGRDGGTDIIVEPARARHRPVKNGPVRVLVSTEFETGTGPVSARPTFAYFVMSRQAGTGLVDSPGGLGSVSLA